MVKVRGWKLCYVYVKSVCVCVCSTVKDETGAEEGGGVGRETWTKFPCKRLNRKESVRGVRRPKRRSWTCVGAAF